MTPNEARRKLASAGFVKTNVYKTNEEWVFAADSKSPIIARVSYSNNPSEQMRFDIVKAIRKAESRKEFEPRPIAKLADEFQKMFKQKETVRYYTCQLCAWKGTTPEQLTAHINANHEVENEKPKVEAPKPVDEVLRRKDGTVDRRNNNKGPATLGFRKFTLEERETVMAKILPLRRTITHEEIAQKLNDEGFKNPNNVRWTNRIIANLFYSWDRRQETRGSGYARLPELDVKPEPKPEPKPAPPPSTGLKVPASLALVLDDSELTVQQKVAILAAAKVQIPASLQLVLEDPSLTDDQKHRIFLTLMGVKS